MNKPFRLLLLLYLLLSALPMASQAQLVFGPGPEGAASTLDAIVAIVDNDVITRRELDAATLRIEAQLRQRKVPIPPRPVLESQVLDRLILSQLQLRAAERNGITVDDATLNAAIETLAQRNNMNLNQLRQTIEKDGVSFAQFRDDVRRELMGARLRQKLVDSQIQVSEQDVDSLQTQLTGQPADRGPSAGNDDPGAGNDGPSAGNSGSSAGGGGREYRIAQILIAVPDGATPQQIEAAKRKAEGVLAQLRQGADFRQLAVSVSASQQALEGGEIGWRSADQLPTLFSDVAPRLQPGQVSGLIRSPSGFHIVKLLEVRGGGSAPARPKATAQTPPQTAAGSTTPEPDRARVREALMRRRADEEWELMLRRLRDEAYVEVRLPAVDASAAEPPANPSAKAANPTP